MPLPWRVTVTGSSGKSAPWMPDYGRDPFSIGITCNPTSTGVTYSVQHTFDPLFFDSQIPGTPVVAATAATWHDHTSISSLNAAADGNYAFPVMGIRVSISSASSATGAVTATFVQAGP